MAAGDYVGWVAANWQFLVGTVLGVAGILAGWLFARSQKQPKRLDYVVTSSTSLISHHVTSTRDLLSVQYKGLPVAQPWLVLIRIVNTGKRAVVSTDYDEPITIAFDGNSPFEVSVVAASRAGAKTDASSDLDAASSEIKQGEPSPVRLRPALLNPGDWIDVQLVSAGNPGAIRVSASFADMESPMKRVTLQAGRPAYGALALTSMAAIALTVVALAVYAAILYAIVNWLPGFYQVSLAIAAFFLFRYPRFRDWLWKRNGSLPSYYS